MARSPLSSPNIKNGKAKLKGCYNEGCCKNACKCLRFSSIKYNRPSQNLCFFRPVKLPIYFPNLQHLHRVIIASVGPGGLGIPKVKSQLKSTPLLLPTICTTCSPQSHIVGDLGLIKLRLFKWIPRLITIPHKHGISNHGTLQARCCC